MSKLKAFAVSGDELGVIIFAESANKARSMGAGADECDCEEYIHLSVRRVPEVDHLADSSGILSWDGNSKIYRDLNWRPTDCTGDCHSCGLSEFDDLPESKLNDDCICKECQHA